MNHSIINHGLTRMDTNSAELLLKEEVFQVVGCAIEVLNTLGHGLVEKPYENGLVLEFSLRKIPFKQQPSFDVLYKGQKIGLFVPELIVFDTLVVDTKLIRQNYLSRTGTDVELSAHHRSACWCNPQL